MLFCEHCGKRLDDGSLFCENCGSPVSYNKVERETVVNNSDDAEHRGESSAFLLFSNSKWYKEWKKIVSKLGNENVGIVFTNYASTQQFSRFESVLKDYIEQKCAAGLHYFVLNIAKQAVRTGVAADCSSNVEILKQVYSVAKPKYLLVIGDDKSVDSMHWPSPCYVLDENGVCVGDRDKIVDSDLPYATLLTQPPQNGQRWYNYDFDQAVRVGRVPASASDGFAAACTYLSHNLNSRLNKNASFALSAQVWEVASQSVYTPPSGQVLTSPPIVLKDFSTQSIQNYCSGEQPGILYFNLHGSDSTQLWYGQENSYAGCIQTFSADCLPQSGSYTLASEACYGAKPNDPTGILCRALTNGCVNFVGSRQIAYGGIRQLSNADILTKEYLRCVTDGISAGDAFVSSLKKLMQSDDIKDTELKTMSEFALYGDPSNTLANGNGSKAVKSAKFVSSLHVPMPDVRGAVQLRLAKVNDQILKLADRFARTVWGEDAPEPITYSLQKNQFVALYAREGQLGAEVLRVYFDEKGQVSKSCVTK